MGSGSESKKVFSGRKMLVSCGSFDNISPGISFKRLMDYHISYRLHIYQSIVLAPYYITPEKSRKTDIGQGQWRQQSGQWTVRAVSRQAAPPGNGWKREHESTFLDSDWPSFWNTVRALIPFLFCLSCQTNHATLTSKFALKGHWISHKAANLCAAGGGRWADEGSSFRSWISLDFFLFIFHPLFPHPLTYHSSIYSSHYFYISPSFPISLSHPLTSSLVPCFKDTGLLEWKLGLSLDIIAKIGPVEWHEVCTAKNIHPETDQATALALCLFLLSFLYVM